MTQDGKTKPRKGTPSPTRSQLDARMLSELADRLERRRVPMLVEKWRADPAGPPAAWQMRRQVRDAMRDEWRRLLGDVKRGELRAVTEAFRQLQRDLDAALLAADPAAFPALAGSAIRRRVAGRR